MNRISYPRKIALVGDYLPRQCGIATFSHDVHHALTGRFPDIECRVVPVNDRPEGYEYPPEVRFEIAEPELDSYRRAADFLNFSNTEVVLVQHEFGIYGGPAGSHVLALLRRLKAPAVVHLHTILEKPDAEQMRVMREMDRLASRFIVMTSRGREMLQRIHGVAPHRIDVIPHGIPDMPFVDPAFYKDLFGVEGRKVLLTFGLLSPGKGIEYVIRALPEVVRAIPDVVYIVLGATHPNLVRRHGESYRMSLERLAAELGVAQHVVFCNRFVTLDELKEFLGAADAYITPYLNPAQITSGTLSYAFGCGKAVISTPYWHAEELLADGRGVLVPFRDSEAIARELISLFTDDVRRNALRKQAYLLGRGMVWSQVACQIMASLTRARAEQPEQVARRAMLQADEEQPHRLPALNLDHLRRLSDSTGIFQHAVFGLPRFGEGYCLDDNARALLLTTLLEETGDDTPELRRLAATYGAFVDHAFIPERGRFHNFMGFDRRWLDEVGSDDSLGRALWALGSVVGRSRDRQLQRWAAQLFDRAVPSIRETTSPRAWAFALLGIREYLRRLDGDRLVGNLRRDLTDRLVQLYQATASDDWLWFEDVLSYANARLAHALILAGQMDDRPEVLEIGLKSLHWLSGLQTSQEGHFAPVGSNGFCKRGHPPARYDQQAIEACSSVAACLEAFNVTGEEMWYGEAWRAFGWFLGRNDLGEPLYDTATGGCWDGLHVDRVNRNQGAESTLCFLLALQEMRMASDSLGVFDQPLNATVGQQ